MKVHTEANGYAVYNIKKNKEEKKPLEKGEKENAK